MKSEKIFVRVAREVVENVSVDLPRFLDSVYEAIMRNFQLFGAEEKFDIYPEEVSLSSVVLYNHRSRSYTRAAIATDDEGNVSFSDIEKVRRQWVPVGDPVERSDDGDSTELEENCFPVEMTLRRTPWASIL